MVMLQIQKEFFGARHWNLYEALLASHSCTVNLNAAFTKA